MPLTFEQIFKYSDVLNPVSPAALLFAGKLAKLNSNSSLLDLGSGKGYPSLLWASVFGIRVEGFDFNQAFVSYASSRARLLNLAEKAVYDCQDLKAFKPLDRYDVVASLGLDLNGIYGGRKQALLCFKSMLKSGGTLILAEPVWLKKRLPQKVLLGLGVKEDDFVTVPVMRQLVAGLGFEETGCFLSSKEDWELYVRPLYISLEETMKEKPELAREAQNWIDGFKTECDAAGEFWNMAIWILRQV